MHRGGKIDHETLSSNNGGKWDPTHDGLSKPHLFAYTDKHISIKKVLADSVGAHQHQGGYIP